MISLRNQSPEIFRHFDGLKRLPLDLEFQGDLDLLTRPYIAVVGAREAHLWAREWMEHELYEFLLNSSVGVVSGGARGIDQWAHQVAIRANKPTLVFLPSGLAQKYPPSLSRLESINGVGFISEYNCDEKMRKYYFHRRNELIAAFAPLTLVIQAGEKSGTILTARAAMALGKTVAVLPGNPTDSSMTGNNQLLFEGAQLVRNSSDLKGLIALIGIN